MHNVNNNPVPSNNSQGAQNNPQPDPSANVASLDDNSFLQLLHSIADEKPKQQSASRLVGLAVQNLTQASSLLQAPQQNNNSLSISRSIPFSLPNQLAEGSMVPMDYTFLEKEIQRLPALTGNFGMVVPSPQSVDTVRSTVTNVSDLNAAQFVKAILSNRLPNWKNDFPKLFDHFCKKLFEDQEQLSKLILFLCVNGYKAQYSLILAPAGSAKTHLVDDGTCLYAIVREFGKKIFNAKLKDEKIELTNSLLDVLDAFKRHTSLSLICYVPVGQNGTVLDALRSICRSHGVHQSVIDILQARIQGYEGWMRGTPNWQAQLPLYSSNPQIVQHALKSKLYRSWINIEDVFGISPLLHALFEEDKQIRNVLLKHGASLEIKSPHTLCRLFRHLLSLEKEPSRNPEKVKAKAKNAVLHILLSLRKKYGQTVAQEGLFDALKKREDNASETPIRVLSKALREDEETLFRELTSDMPVDASDQALTTPPIKSSSETQQEAQVPQGTWGVVHYTIDSDGEIQFIQQPGQDVPVLFNAVPSNLENQNKQQVKPPNQVRPIQARPIQVLPGALVTQKQPLPPLKENLEYAARNLNQSQKHLAVEIYNSFYSELKILVTDQNDASLAQQSLEENQGIWALTLRVEQDNNSSQIELLKGLLKVYQQKIQAFSGDNTKIDLLDSVLWHFFRALHFYRDPTESGHLDKELQRSMGVGSSDQTARSRYNQILARALYNDPAEGSEPSMLVPLETEQLVMVRDALMYLKLKELQNSVLDLLSDVTRDPEVVPCFLVMNQQDSYKAYMMQLGFDEKGHISTLLLDTKGICQKYLPQGVVDDGCSAVLDARALAQLRVMMEEKNNHFYLIEPATLQQLVQEDIVKGTNQRSKETTKQNAERGEKGKRTLPFIDFSELSKEVSKRVSNPAKPKKRAQSLTTVLGVKGATTSDTKSTMMIDYPESSESSEGVQPLLSSAGEAVVDITVSSSSARLSVKDMLKHISKQHLANSLSALQRRLGDAALVNVPITYPLLERLVQKSEKDLQKEAQTIRAWFPGLKPYQETALKLLRLLNKSGINGLLSLDMGLGKTLVMAELILSQFIQQKQEGSRKPILLMAPSSILIQTKRKFEGYIYAAESKMLLHLAADLQHMSENQQEKFWLIVSSHLRHKVNPEIYPLVQKFCSGKSGVESKKKTLLEQMLLHCNTDIDLYGNPRLREIKEEIDSSDPSFEQMWALYLEALKLDHEDDRNFRLVNLLTTYFSASLTVAKQATIPKSTAAEINELLNNPIFEIYPKRCIKVCEKKSDLLRLIDTAQQNPAGQIIITTPESLLGAKDMKPEVFDELQVEAFLVDEAHMLRNPDSNLTKSVRPFAEKIVQNSRTITLVTGTPFEKDPSDICTLLSIANPKAGFDQEAFKTLKKKLKAASYAFGSLIRQQQGEQTELHTKQLAIASCFAHMEVFKRVINTVIVRARKTDRAVIAQWEGAIPQKQHCPVAYTITQEQAEKIAELQGDEENRQFLKRWAQTTDLLFHPEAGNNKAGFEAYIARSGLLSAFFKSPALQELVQSKKSFLVFVDQIKHGEMLSQLLKQKFKKDIKVDFLYGEVKLEERDRMVREILESQPQSRCLILTVGVGGVGLDIPGKDIFMLAKPWNPSERLQAEDRSIRVGHAGTVKIHTFLNNEIDRRYKFLYEMKERWEEYLFLTVDEATVEKRFSSFIQLVSSLYCAEEDTACEGEDIQKVVETLSHVYSASKLEQLINGVTPESLPALLRIKKAATQSGIVQSGLPSKLVLKESNSVACFDVVGNGEDFLAVLQQGSAEALARVQHSVTAKSIAQIRQKNADHTKLLTVLRHISSPRTIEECLEKRCSMEIYRAVEENLVLHHKKAPESPKATIRLLQDGDKYHLLLRSLDNHHTLLHASTNSAAVQAGVVL